EPERRIPRLILESVRERFSPDGVLRSSPRRVIRKVPVKGRESVNEHGLRVIGWRTFICVACGDQAVADRAAAGRADVARPRAGGGWPVAPRRCLCPRRVRGPCPRRPPPAPPVHVKLVVWSQSPGAAWRP